MKFNCTLGLAATRVDTWYPQLCEIMVKVAGILLIFSKNMSASRSRIELDESMNDFVMVPTHFLLLTWILAHTVVDQKLESRSYLISVVEIIHINDIWMKFCPNRGKSFSIPTIYATKKGNWNQIDAFQELYLLDANDWQLCLVVSDSGNS